MGVSLKCQYGLRAMFELARHYHDGLTGLHEIARAQAIPLRFLANIMNLLRQGGLVESRRGHGGGFALSRAPGAITVGDIIHFIDGGIYTIDCEGERPTHACPLKGGCVFLAIWKEARAALEAVYHGKTLQDLLDAESAAGGLNYMI